MKQRNIGIVGDGRTDRQIFQKLITCILNPNSTEEVEFNFIDLKRQSIRDAVDKYWRHSQKNDQYDLFSDHAQDLENAVTTTLVGAFNDFQSELELGLISNNDLLILTTDAEKKLAKAEDYFKPFSFSLPHILMGAVEKFYQIQLQHSYSYECLPLVMTMATYPSADVLVAAAKEIKSDKIYNKKPSELKLMLYETDNISTLTDEQFEKKALKFINSTSINKIFQQIPESRTFIQTLSLAQISPSAQLG